MIGPMMGVVQIVRCVTATLVNLGGPFERLLSQELNAVIERDLVEGELGVEMGAQTPELDVETSKQRLTRRDKRFAEAIARLETLRLRVTVFDKRLQDSEDCQVLLDVRAKGDFSRNRVVVRSELDFERHVALVERLRDIVMSSDKGDG